MSKISTAFALILMLGFTSRAASISECADPFLGIGPVAIQAAIHDLAKFRLSLDLAEAKGNEATFMQALSDDYPRKQAELSEFLQTRRLMASSALAEKIRLEIEKLQKESVIEQRKETEHRKELKQPTIDGKNMVFHWIRKGSFNIGDARRKHKPEVTFDRPFGMMATPMTQVAYKAVANLVAQHLPGKYVIDPDPSEQKGDLLPVVDISWTETKEWIKALNDLSQAGVLELKQWIVGWKPGKTYRLPSEAEFEYVSRNLGEWQGTHPEGITAENIEDYGKIGVNQRNAIEDVAIRTPIFVEGMAFYGLIGNVHQWVEDHGDGWGEHMGGLNPVNTSGWKRGVRGWAYYVGNFFDLGSRRFEEDKKASSISFRLVENN